MKPYKRLFKEIEKPIYKNGDSVRVPNKGRMVKGKIVRYDKGDSHGSPFYIVDIGEYASIKVPAHNVEEIK